MSAEVFTITLDCEIKSKKNGKIARIQGGRFLGMMERPEVRRSQQAVEDRVRRQLERNHQHTAGPFYAREVSLELLVSLDKDNGLTHLQVRPIGEIPKKGPNGRRRDIQNELALICDALEKAGLVANDNQIAKITIERVVQGQVR